MDAKVKRGGETGDGSSFHFWNEEPSPVSPPLVSNKLKLYKKLT